MGANAAVRVGNQRRDVCVAEHAEIDLLPNLAPQPRVVAPLQSRSFVCEIADQ